MDSVVFTRYCPDLLQKHMVAVAPAIVSYHSPHILRWLVYDIVPLLVIPTRYAKVKSQRQAIRDVQEEKIGQSMKKNGSDEQT